VEDKKIGLALGGGAVLGAAHIGVLQAIEEQQIRVAAMSGTSIGSVIAALYSFGKTPEEIKQIALEVDWKSISSLVFSRLGVLSDKKIAKLLIDNIGDVDFKDAKIPLSMVATDITNGEKVVLKSGSVAKSAMASSAIPGVFVPVEIDERLLVDGGLVENVPISTLGEFDVDYIIAVDLNAKHSHKKPSSLVEVLLNTFDIVMNASTSKETQSTDLLISLDLSEFNALSTSQIERLIEAGYKCTSKQLKEMKDEKF